MKKTNPENKKKKLQQKGQGGEKRESDGRKKAGREKEKKVGEEIRKRKKSEWQRV